MDESVGDEGPEYKVPSFVCEACAAEQSARRRARKDRDVQGEQGDDLLDGRYWVAVVASE